ncbi:MAG TPA: PAS domain S-box protein [Spirochaetota bacterium]|nr:PAS domain S-box protein [Spirochaetota bacterium]
MSRKRILLAEDESIISLDIASILKGLGYEMAGIVATGEAAIAEAESSRPDLVLMDIVLKGGMDGIAAAEAIQTRLGIPVIYLTGNADMGTVSRARQTNPYGYILKPVSAQDVFTTIDTALHRHELERAVREKNAELAALNEELGQALEELESTNEQLRVSNESLEREAAERASVELERDEREREVELFFRSGLDLFCIADTDGYFRRLNPEWERALGYSIDELEGKRFLDLVHPDDVEATMNAIGELAGQREVHNFTNRYLCKDGSYRWIEWRALLAGTLIYAAARDITEQRAAMESLAESEARFRTLFDTTTLGIVYQAADGRIELANQAALDALGLTLDQMQGRTSFDPRWRSIYEDGADCPGDEHPAMVALRTGETVRGRVMGVYRPSDGSYRWLLIDAVPDFRPGEERPYRVFATFLDITERRSIADALRESEGRYRLLFENMTSGFALHEMLFDDAGTPVDYRFLEINPAFERLTGLRAESLVGKTVREALPGTEEYWIRTYGEVAMTGEPRTFQNYSQDLDRYYDVIAFCPQRGMFAVVFSDVTEAQRTHRIIQASLREKETLLKEIHHRVKNNFQLVTSLLSLQSMSVNDEHLEREFSEAQGRVRSMALVHEKLYQSADLGSIDFAEYAREMSQSLSRSFAGGRRAPNIAVNAVEVRLGVDKAIPCGLILNELVTNSCKHAFPESWRGDPAIAVDLSEEGGAVTLRVSDNGVGIADAVALEQPQTFGLSLVSLLARQLRGTIRVARDGGTAVTVEFPGE